jgi:actinorhodin biosynthesis protein ActVIA
VSQESVIKVSGDLYAEVQTFYARQMRRVDALDIEGFAATFTEDGVVVHGPGGGLLTRSRVIHQDAPPLFEGV